jgi:hypothetical protein
VPFAVLAIAVARRRFAQRPIARGQQAAAAPAIARVVLPLAGLLTREGGAPMPAGGRVLEGTLTPAVDAQPVPVGRWTSVALTYDGAQERLYVNGAGSG